jgi:ATP-dependent RNA helicase RhlE
VAQALYPTSEPLKTSLLVALLKHNGRRRTLIFCRTKIRVQRLAAILRQEGHRVAALEGDMSQHRRQAAIDGFRQGRHTVLVATDVAARGIDVTAIETVVNYDMPETFEIYTHRVGRTGRANLTGEALNLVSVMDTPLVREIQEHHGQALEQRTVPGFDYGSYTPYLRIIERPTHRGRPGALGSRRRGGGSGSRRTARIR